MITQATLEAVFAKLTEQPLNDELISALRADFSTLHFTYCSDDDICDVKPAMEHQNFNLYLIDGREHCLTLTTDASIATGIVVAEVFEP